MNRCLTSPCGARSSLPAAPSTPPHTAYTTAHRSADACVQPRTCHTAQCEVAPSGNNDLSAALTASARVCGVHASEGADLHQERRTVVRLHGHNLGGAIQGDVTELDDLVANGRGAELLCGHTRIQPQTFVSVNHKQGES